MPESTVTDPQNTIAFQGMPGAHSDMACKIAHPYMHTRPYPTFEEAMEAVEKGEAKLAMIPVENSHAGRVAEIHNILPTTSLNIIGEFFHKVRHFLMGPKGATLEGVKRIYSHKQALMQCHNFIMNSGAEELVFYDTAAAAQQVSEWNDPERAAIASNLAAELYGLGILKEDIQDADDNRTLFLTFSKDPDAPDLDKTTQKLTSLLFTTRNISAGLYKALGGFATNGINLLKLESYIQDYASGKAQFFVTFAGSPEDRHVQHALEELGFFSEHVKLLGVYPAAAERFNTSE